MIILPFDRGNLWNSAQIFSGSAPGSLVDTITYVANTINNILFFDNIPHKGEAIYNRVSQDKFGILSYFIVFGWAYSMVWILLNSIFFQPQYPAQLRERRILWFKILTIFSILLCIPIIYINYEYTTLNFFEEAWGFGFLLRILFCIVVFAGSIWLWSLLFAISFGVLLRRERLLLSTVYGQWIPGLLSSGPLARNG